MVAHPQPKPYTRTEFLAWEATQADRWEFVGGRVKMMAGGSVAHNIIAGNVFAAFVAALGDGPCVAFQQNQKLTPVANEDVSYPDVLVTCRPVLDEDLTVSEATVIVEVLSPSTRQDDLDRKWEGYQQIGDLRHYLLLESTSAAAILFSRDDGGWRYERITDPAAEIPLPTIGVTLTLQGIYRRTSLLGLTQ